MTIFRLTILNTRGGLQSATVATMTKTNGDKMLSQKEFVEGCYNWYREADLQPGNPEDGQWDEAHYPVPKCKGGTETILLLREHHAVQGVIQSEELQWRCIFNWERKYLSGEYLELFNKWLSEGSKLFWVNKTEEERILWSEKSRDANARLTEEEKILRAEKSRANAVAQHARMTEAEKILRAERHSAKLIEYHAQLTEEEKILRDEMLRAKSRAYYARMTEEERILKAERHSAKMIASHARRRFNKEVEDLVAVWEMGLRP